MAKQFEYMKLNIGTVDGEKKMKEIGIQGWEAVGPYASGVFLFKRELSNELTQEVQRPRPPASGYDVSR
jgi:hypothetical protein